MRRGIGLVEFSLGVGLSLAMVFAILEVVSQMERTNARARGQASAMEVAAMAMDRIEHELDSLEVPNPGQEPAQVTSGGEALAFRSRAALDQPAVQVSLGLDRVPGRLTCDGQPVGLPGITRLTFQLTSTGPAWILAITVESGGAGSGPTVGRARLVRHRFIPARRPGWLDEDPVRSSDPAAGGQP